MKLFKNYKTKKQLREEIVHLKFLNDHKQMPIIKVEKNLIQVGSSYTINEYGLDMPMDIVKEMISNGIAREISPLIKYDMRDGINRGEKIVVGTIRVEVN